MQKIGVVFNPQIAEAPLLAGAVSHWLEQQSAQHWVSSTDEGEVTGLNLSESKLLVVIGGDGTTLMAGRLAAPYNVPIFGINLGRVGFLSEADPDAWQEKLLKVLEEQHWLERRLMIEARVMRSNEVLSQLTALNDVVVSRGAQVRVVRFHLFVDGAHVMTYSADALISATPTGSTAYSLAAGGPLLPPQLQNYIVLPVAPHLSFERPLVLHQEAVVKIKVQSDFGAIVTADGQDAVELQDGDEVEISKHSCESIFARLEEPSYFYRRLMQRLGYWSLKQYA
ncbi:MAG TPA: NAD(+)/NADH kinase [Patescibacteria group bacterium]|jgi:NAD+ kinase|nr:NAD(+)/NADH kinase [Patescibacteria group bacterium]